MSRRPLFALCAPWCTRDTAVPLTVLFRCTFREVFAVAMESDDSDGRAAPKTQQSAVGPRKFQFPHSSSLSLSLCVSFCGSPLHCIRHIFSTMASLGFTPEGLSDLKRRELQSLAKEHNIKANAKVWVLFSLLSLSHALRDTRTHAAHTHIHKTCHVITRLFAHIHTHTHTRTYTNLLSHLAASARPSSPPSLTLNSPSPKQNVVIIAELTELYNKSCDSGKAAAEPAEAVQETHEAPPAVHAPTPKPLSNITTPKRKNQVRGAARLGYTLAPCSCLQRLCQKEGPGCDARLLAFPWRLSPQPWPSTAKFVRHQGPRRALRASAGLTAPRSSRWRLSPPACRPPRRKRCGLPRCSEGRKSWADDSASVPRLIPSAPFHQAMRNDIFDEIKRIMLTQTPKGSMSAALFLSRSSSCDCHSPTCFFLTQANPLNPHTPPSRSRVKDLWRRCVQRTLRGGPVCP